MSEHVPFSALSQAPHLALHPDQPNSDRVRAVRHRIAAAILPPLGPETLGEVRLLPHQRTATARLLGIIQRYRGALLADAVGLGKTYTALAVAQHYDRSVVLAPAGLLAMWQAALLRTGQRHITLHSLHRASLHAPPPFAGSGGEGERRTLVIIDEAHALRNDCTARYRHVAGAVTGCDVLLLSATPLHNTTQDLHTLFALFRGTHADAAHRDTLSALIVRREHLPARSSSVNPDSAPPPLRAHRPHTVPQDSRTLDRLLALPAPFPARDGAVAGALIRLGLLRAWCSSDAALTHALNRRIQRGAAMREALDAGRHPTPGELRSWVIDEELGTDMQLGFPELLAGHTVEVVQDARTMIELLARHCDALRELRTHHTASARADHVRAAYLRNIRAKHPGVPVVAFSQHARTIQSLYRALSDIAGVGMLTSRQARIATGPIARTELLGYFAPRAHGRPPPPPTLQISLLLTTDLIAEGVNLQDAGVVVHLDLPWTHALRTQRTGRVVRIGSPHALVHEYRFRASPGARRVLRAESLVARKALITSRFVGSAAQSSPADTQNGWMERLVAWASERERDRDDSAPVRIAHMTSEERVHGALVLVRSAGSVYLLAVVRCHDGRLWVSTRADALLALSEGRRPPRCPARAEAKAQATLPPARIRRVVDRWLAHHRLRLSSGVAAVTSATGEESEAGATLGMAQQCAMHWLRQLVTSWSALERQRRGTQVAEARQCIAAAQGAGCEAALRCWTLEPRPSADAVRAWRNYPELVRAVETDGSAAAFAARATVDTSTGLSVNILSRTATRIEACLLIVPPENSGSR